MNLSANLEAGCGEETTSRVPWLDLSPYRVRIDTGVLAPRLMRGSIVLVDPLAAVRPGDTVFAVIGSCDGNLETHFFEWFNGALDEFDIVRAVHKVVRVEPPA